VEDGETEKEKMIDLLMDVARAAGLIMLIVICVAISIAGLALIDTMFNNVFTKAWAKATTLTKWFCAAIFDGLKAAWMSFTGQTK
jgi:hypothetical protein